MHIPLKPRLSLHKKRSSINLRVPAQFRAEKVEFIADHIITPQAIFGVMYDVETALWHSRQAKELCGASHELTTAATQSLIKDAARASKGRRKRRLNIVYYAHKRRWEIKGAD